MIIHVVVIKVFPGRNYPYHEVNVTCFGKSVQALTKKSFLHLPLNLCKIIHAVPLEK